MTSTPENKDKRSTDTVASSPARRNPDYPSVARPSESAQETRSDSKSGAASSMPTPKPAKRKKNRNNRKRRHRRQSFLTAEESESPSQQFKPATAPAADTVAKAQSAANDQSKSRARLPFYGLGRDLSDTSLESEALLDHRYGLYFFALISNRALTFLVLFPLLLFSILFDANYWVSKFFIENNP